MASKGFWHNMGGIQNQWWSDIKHQTKKESSNFTRDTWYWSEKKKDLRPDKFFKILKMQNKHNKRNDTVCSWIYLVEYEEKNFIWFPNRIVYLTIEWKEEYDIFKLTLCLKDGSFHKVDSLVESNMSLLCISIRLQFFCSPSFFFENWSWTNKQNIAVFFHMLPFG